MISNKNIKFNLLHEFRQQDFNTARLLRANPGGSKEKI